MSETFHNSPIDTELQVRLMNLVMGEASDFERDQLQSMMEQRAELAAYYQHVEHLHGLLCEVGMGELHSETANETANEAATETDIKAASDVDSATTDGAWQLSADRRSQLLAVLDKPISAPSSDSPEKVTLANKAKPKRWRMSYALVGTVALSACVLIGLMLPSVQMARRATPLARREFDRHAPPSRFDDVAAQSEPAVVLFDAEQAERSTSQNLPESLLSVIAGKSTVPQSGMGLDDLRDQFAREVYEAHEADALRQLEESSASTNLPSPYYRQDNVHNFGEDIAGNSASDPAEGWAAEPKGLARSIDQPIAGDMGMGYGGTEGIADVELNSAGGLPGSMGGSGSASGGRMAGGMGGGGMISGDMGGMANDSSVYFDKGRSSQLADIGETTSFELGFPAAEPQVALANNAPAEPQSGDHWAIDDYGFQGLNGPTDAVPAKPNSQNGLDGESNDFSALLRTVTPSIIVPENEEERPFGNSDYELEVQPSDGPMAYSHSEGWQDLSNRRRDGYGEAGEAGESNGRQSGSESKGNLNKELDVLAVEEGLFGDVPIEYVDEVGTVIIRGSKQNVERTMEQMARLKESALDEKKFATPEMLGKTEYFNTPQEVLEQNSDFAYDARVPARADSGITKDNQADVSESESLEELQKREISLGRLFTPAPSPEAVTRGRRSNIEMEGKPSAPKQAVALDEQSASTEAFSTFSLHVSDVSFKLAQTALAQGQWPEAAKIRIEEFVNALDYHDPLPSSDQKVACQVEQAIHPFLMQRNLLRVSMRTAATGRSQNTPLRLTLLLDNSGSMERPDRRQAVLRAFQALTQQLGANDQITLISFANTPRLLADKVPGNQGETLLQLIESLPSEGGTNIEAALQLAHEKAAEQQFVGAQNRIVLLTDGAVNLGNANPESLSKLVTKMRDTGIAFDAAGISALDLNDEVLEALTRQGDGRYYLLDSAESIGESFAAQIAGALRPSAKNVKVQVEFNPQRVGRYKLLGFEKHRLNKEDFRNDQVDAAEMTATEAGVAVYQFEIKPNGSGDVGNVSVRFRDLATGQMVERRWPIPYESNARRLEQAEPSMQLAATAALFAAKLSGGPLADSVELPQLASLVTQLPEQVASQPRVQQLRSMIVQAITIGN